MSTPKVALFNPILLLGGAVLSFAGWIAFDARAPGSVDARSEPDELAFAPNPQCDTVGAHLNTLKLGQPRLTVEQRLAPLSGPEVDPIDVSGGRPVFRERYHIHLAHPIAIVPTPTERFVPGPHVLTVEFDVGAPGHPLTRVALAPVPFPPSGSVVAR